jgi:hypothetical protein
MTERFVTTAGTISVATNASVALGTGTLFSGRDRAAAWLTAYPADSAPVHVGVVAEVDPRGVYDNLQLPLVMPYKGTALVNVAFTLVDGAAIANGATQAAIYARFAAHIEQNMGLVGNMADAIDYALVPNNSLFVDDVTRTIYQWRNGVLEIVTVVATPWTPRGAWSGATTYALNDLVQSGNFIFVSNGAGNLNHAPNTAPASTAYWTYVPLPTVQQVLDTLGIHTITVSTAFPSGGQNGDLWFRVA